MAKGPANIIYSKQNKSLHKAFSASGMPYSANRVRWQPVLKNIAGHEVSGLSDMTLGERYKLIQSFQRKGHSLHNPRVYKGLWNWKKGDPVVVVASAERPLEVPGEKQGMVDKIGAILADNKLPWSYADAIAQKRFKVQVVEWLRPNDLEKVMQMLIISNRRHGGEE